MRTRVAPLLIALAAAVPLTTTPSHVQTPTQKLVFEVATIKPHATENGTHFVCHATDNGMASGSTPALGRCLIQGFTFQQLLATAAYNIQTSLVVGGPSWITSDQFDIEAKAEDPTTSTRAGLRLMIQSLLADRFNLSFHREVRETAGYLLVVDKNGTKLQEARDEAPSEATKNQPRSTCLGTRVPYGAGINGRNTGAGCIAQFLSDRFGRPVLDKTGLSGSYTFSLLWAPGDNEVGPLAGPLPKTNDSNGPSLFTALQDQLGLRLEARKVSTEVFVIDHVEKPTLN